MVHVHHTSVPGLLTQYLHRLISFCFAIWNSAQPGAGTYLMSSSYDKTCKIFSCQDWSLVKTLSGHEDKVMRAEISPGAFSFAFSAPFPCMGPSARTLVSLSPAHTSRCQFASSANSRTIHRHLSLDSQILRADSKHIATVCWDRSWKLWGL
jgi:hypothetical protein